MRYNTALVAAALMGMHLVPMDEGYPANHVWIRLADGRVLDPTADQFPALNLPPVYLGKPLSPIHRPVLDSILNDGEGR